MGFWTPNIIWGAAWKRVWNHLTLSGVLARMPQIPFNAHFLNFLFKWLIWIMCASLPWVFLLQDTANKAEGVEWGEVTGPWVCFDGNAVSCDLKSLQTQCSLTKRVIKSQIVFFFFCVTQRKSRHCCANSLWISSKTWPRGLSACVRRIIWGLSLIPQRSHQLICSITS